MGKPSAIEGKQRSPHGLRRSSGRAEIRRVVKPSWSVKLGLAALAATLLTGVLIAQTSDPSKPPIPPPPPADALAPPRLMSRDEVQQRLPARFASMRDRHAARAERGRSGRPDYSIPEPPPDFAAPESIEEIEERVRSQTQRGLP
jgi:hypothetical protein